MKFSKEMISFREDSDLELAGDFLLLFFCSGKKMLSLR